MALSSHYLLRSPNLVAVLVEGGLDIVRVDEPGLHRDPDQGPEPVAGQHQAPNEPLDT